MPIYAYRCAACGHARDMLRKISDPVLTDCPACGEARFEKQLTAAGFQLKGSGWYVTDFRNGSAGAKDKAADVKPAGGSGDAKPAGVAKPAGDTGTAAGSGGGGTSAASGSSAAAGCAGSCACH